MTHHNVIHDIIVNPTPAAQRPVELLRPSFYALLGLYYTATFFYGVTAAIFGVHALIVTNSTHFAFVWAIILGAAGLVAALGVKLSRQYKLEWIEVISTTIIIGLLMGYAVAIVVRALTDPSAAATFPSVWLPIIVSLLPVWRLTMIALEGNLFANLRKKRTDERLAQ